MAEDRLRQAVRRLKASDGLGRVTAENDLDEAVREALECGVSNQRIRQITGYPPKRLNAMRPAVAPKLRAVRPEVLDSPAPSLPVGWPPDMNAVLSYKEKEEGPEVYVSQSIRTVSGGLPGLGRRR
jgi:hypothetical protein